MNKLETFESFLVSQSVHVPIFDFIVNLFLAALVSHMLSLIYVRYGNALSNRSVFSKNLVILTMTTTVVITIIKSSLALSLGLVGALSIVRFRAAIKEPEELAYLFLAIAVGLGFGADQRAITLIAFVVITAIIWLRHYGEGEALGNQNLYITIVSDKSQQVELSAIMKILKEFCSAVDLRRFDETKEVMEATFRVGFDEIVRFEKAKAKLQQLNENMEISFLDHENIIA
jgi:hypothetical protein